MVAGLPERGYRASAGITDFNRNGRVIAWGFA